MMFELRRKEILEDFFEHSLVVTCIMACPADLIIMLVILMFVYYFIVDGFS
jgi:hypothetical protein